MEKISVVENQESLDQPVNNENKSTKEVVEKKDKKGPKKEKNKKPFKMKWWMWLLAGLGAVLVILLTASLVVANSYRKITSEFTMQANVTMDSARVAYDLFKAQDLNGVNNQLQTVRAEYGKLETIFNRYSTIGSLPGVKQYYADGQTAFAAGYDGLDAADKAMAAILPYADVLGLNGEENVEEGAGTTEDKVKTLLDTLTMVGPELDGIMVSLSAMNDKIGSIDASRYPEKVGDLPFVTSYLKGQGKADLADMDLRANLQNVQATSDLAVQTFAEYRPVIEKIPQMAGADGKRQKYLILFQNDNELRPTGGFLTAYAVVFVEDGKVTPEKSDDIYEMDKKFTKRIPIPEKLGKYLTSEQYWNLRDMNISPDLKISMADFLENYKTVKGEPQDIDGIIVIDTYVLTELMKVLGPAEVPGYGTFTAEPDAKYGVPEVVIALSEIITRPTPYIREDRKGVLGPLMQILLSKVYTAPKQNLPQLFQVALKSMEGRHVQAYFLNEELQDAAEKINLAGRMIAPTDGSDFIGIVDANLGGAKSNLFITYDVTQTVGVPENGELEKLVSITYKNSRPGDNCNLEAGLLCLNSTNNDWHRLYLPLGSKLISAKGFKGEPEVYEENGFTVIDGFFSLNPDSTAKVEINYALPYQNPTDYKLYIWKQGGVEEVKHLLDVNGGQEEIIVTKDTIYETEF